MKNFDKLLRASGEMVSNEGLANPTEAKIVRAGQDGAPVVNDEFPAMKEFISGYWIVDVPSPERAYRIVAQASAVTGPRGAPLNIPIEVRQIMPGPPDEPVPLIVRTFACRDDFPVPLQPDF